MMLCKPKINKVDYIFDVEEKEEIENEEVDKLILNSLCSEIMNEVMDLSSAYPQDCNTTPMFKSSSTATVGTLWTGYPSIQASRQDREQGVLPRAATWPVAPDLPSLPRRAPVLPHVPQLWTPPPCRGEL
jgi:hypothetical protein